MNNFIVGQVTPDMLSGITYGTYIFFGLLTFGGALFVWLYVPETKGLSLEEMDVLFGSIGMAEKERERWREVNREAGLEQLVAKAGIGVGGEKGVKEEEKENTVIEIEIEKPARTYGETHDELAAE